MLAFLPCGTHPPSRPIREKEDDVALLAGEQQKKLPAGVGAGGESTGEPSPTESTHTGTEDGETLGQESRWGEGDRQQL